MRSTEWKKGQIDIMCQKNAAGRIIAKFISNHFFSSLSCNKSKYYEYNTLLLLWLLWNKVQIAEPNPLKVIMDATLVGDQFYKPNVYLC